MNKTLINILVGTVVGALILYAGILIAPKANDVNVGAVSSPWSVGPESGVNGLISYVASGDMPNSTTTLVSVKNPTTATSVIDFIQLEQIGVATSSFRIACGTDYRASAKQPASTPANIYFVSGTQATSTSFFDKIQTATSSPIYLGPSQYFLCVAQGPTGEDSLKLDGGWDNAFTNITNTFTGRFKVRLLRSIW